MKKLRLAVLMTCHNRQAKTLTCLEALCIKQVLPQSVQIQVYLVDDGSTDGTGEFVRSNYPEVKLLQGSGNLFWNGGMRLAFAEAIKYDYDYYLWLNDDTILYPQAINTLLETSNDLSKQGYAKTVLVGSTQNINTSLVSYGGLIRSSRWHPLKFRLIEPSNEAKPCSTMNGNCVLLSREVVQSVGNLDVKFTHSTGDFDYGLRTHKNGGSVWLAPGYVGTCEYNPLRHQAWDEPNLTLPQRWEKINQPRGLPIREWRVFARRHAGWLWIFYWLLPYVRLLLKSGFHKLVRE